jgi:hypothetical protein
MCESMLLLAREYTESPHVFGGTRDNGSHDAFYEKTTGRLR